MENMPFQENLEPKESKIERIKNKVIKYGRKFMMAATLASMAGNIQAEAPQGQEGSLGSKQGMEQGGKASWAVQNVHDAEMKAGTLRTQNEFEWYGKDHIHAFTKRLGMLGQEDEQAQQYSPQDYRIMYIQAKNLKFIIGSLQDKFTVPISFIKDLDYVISYLSRKSSTTDLNQKGNSDMKKRIEQMEKGLKNL